MVSGRVLQQVAEAVRDDRLGPEVRDPEVFVEQLFFGHFRVLECVVDELSEERGFGPAGAVERRAQLDEEEQLLGGLVCGHQEEPHAVARVHDHDARGLLKRGYDLHPHVLESDAFDAVPAAPRVLRVVHLAQPEADVCGARRVDCDRRRAAGDEVGCDP